MESKKPLEPGTKAGSPAPSDPRTNLAHNETVRDMPVLPATPIPEAKLAPKRPFFNWVHVGFIAAFAVIALLVGAKLLLARPKARNIVPATPDQPATFAEEDTITVKTIHARLDPSFTMTVTQPAYVAPYYSIDLRARVAGPVSFLVADIGTRVKEGVELIRINVPDLEQDLNKKKGIVKQREEEVKVAQAAIKRAEADLKIAEAEVGVAEAARERYEKALNRYKKLLKQDAIDEDAVDEQNKLFRTSVAGVAKAKADVGDAEAKIGQANADLGLKQALVEVAVKERDQAEEMLGYATLKAPFNGVVTRRNVDPGSFVQNSATAHSDPLLTIERTDIVTIYTNLPDNYAQFVTMPSKSQAGTEAVIEMSELPGVHIRGQVTRYAPSLVNPSHDRTMRVEIDLYNRSAKNFANFLNRYQDIPKDKRTDLKGGDLPLFPKFENSALHMEEGERLMPGMYGKMTLVLQKFKHAYLIPSNAVFSQGGKPYIYVIKDGIAHLTPVNVRVDDGKLAYVDIVELSGREDRKVRLTGEEEIVSCNQNELSDGQRVKTTAVDW
jgi:multidrug efflux pump subunit AcrA (membrane-fusion protein)